MLTFLYITNKITFVRRSGGMADAQASGACYGNIVWVQVPSPASSFLEAHAEVSELADEQDSGSCVGFHV